MERLKYFANNWICNQNVILFICSYHKREHDGTAFLSPLGIPKNPVLPKQDAKFTAAHADAVPTTANKFGGEEKKKERKPERERVCKSHSNQMGAWCPGMVRRVCYAMNRVSAPAKLV